MASILSQGQVYFRMHEPFLLLCHYLSSLVCKSAFLHNGYIAAIENCCAPFAVKCTLFHTFVVRLLLDASFNMIFATRLISLLLGASLNTKLSLQKNFILEHYSYYMIKCLKCVTVD